MDKKESINEGLEEPKLTDGFGMKQLGLTNIQIQAIEKYVKRYVEFLINNNHDDIRRSN